MKINLYTLKLKGRYLGEDQSISKDFINAIHKEFKIAKRDSGGIQYTFGNGICSFCFSKEEVYGATNPLKFFTQATEGFFPGITRTKSYYNFPVCRKCAFLLNFGKVFLEENLDINQSIDIKKEERGIAGHPCYLIPKFSFIEKREEFYFLNHLIEIARNKIFIHREAIENIKDREDAIQDQEKIPALTYHFLFYKKEKEEFNIIKLIEDVLPSQITKIFNAIQDLNKHHGGEQNEGKYGGRYFLERTAKARVEAAPPRSR